jgi:hypothetical protein
MRTKKPSEADVLRQIHAYGASPRRWSSPSSETALLAQAGCDDAVAAALEQAGKLDRSLDHYQVHPRADVQALLRRLPAQAPPPAKDWWIESLKWFLPDDWRLVWRPALAGVVPVVFGFYLGQVVPVGDYEGLWGDDIPLDLIILSQNAPGLSWEDLLIEQGGGDE